MFYDDGDLDEPAEDDDCDHAEADIDTLEGIARCRCGRAWVPSEAEMNAELAWQTECMERMFWEAERGAGAESAAMGQGAES